MSKGNDFPVQALLTRLHTSLMPTCKFLTYIRVDCIGCTKARISISEHSLGRGFYVACGSALKLPIMKGC